LVLLKSWYELQPTHICVQRLTDKAFGTVLALFRLPFLKAQEQSTGIIASFQRAYVLVEYDVIWRFVTLIEQGRIVIAESNEHMHT
jgi:hypothetical protein